LLPSGVDQPRRTTSTKPRPRIPRCSGAVRGLNCGLEVHPSVHTSVHPFVRTFSGPPQRTPRQLGPGPRPRQTGRLAGPIVRESEVRDRKPASPETSGPTCAGLANHRSQPISGTEMSRRAKRGRRSVAPYATARTRRQRKQVFRPDRHDDRRVDEAARLGAGEIGFLIGSEPHPALLVPQLSEAARMARNARARPMLTFGDSGRDGSYVLPFASSTGRALSPGTASPRALGSAEERRRTRLGSSAREGAQSESPATLSTTTPCGY
jgi:hypothetical protein